MGHFGRVLGCNTHEAFSVPRLTVGVSNEVQMARNLTGGLPVVTQGHMFNPTHEKRYKGALEEIGVPECKTDNEENARMHETNTYANAMHMMT